MGQMPQLDELVVNTIRTLSIDAIQKAESGHPGLPMGTAVIAWALWSRHLKHNPANPKWADRDRFVLSAGHGSMLLYSLLHLTGYDLPLDEIKNFRQWGSKTPGHPENILTPGVEVTTGPLGQGAGNAVGMAMAEAFLATRYGKEVVNHYTYCLVGDGDLMEGVSAEACSLAGHLGLGKLIFFYDNNGITIDGATKLAFSEDVPKRFEAYGWHILHVDGNDWDGVLAAIDTAKSVTDKPTFINCKTTIGYGSPNRAGSNKVHGAALGAEEVKLTKQNLGFPADQDFYIPEEALTEARKSVERGAKWEAEWNSKFQTWKGANPDLAAEWELAWAGKIPAGFDSELPVWKAGDGLATRAAFGKALNASAHKVPYLIGGSADLAESTNTDIEGETSFSRENFAGRILHWGVREHGMGAALNGMMLHGGVKAFGSTFFVFSDYMRPSVRLAALSEVAPIYIWTNDSIGLGEDGPTHQPVEHLAAVRAIPNLTNIRPGDANETAVAWSVALQHQHGPVSLILSRQKLPVVDREKYASAEGVRKGAYVLAGNPNEEPDVILMASGSELQLAVGAYEKLVAEGVKARLVSFPSFELFEIQPQEYKDSVLPPSVKARVSVEAAAALGWREYVGFDGEMISQERFGASAPLKDVMTHFGFTVDNVYTRAKAVLDKVRGVAAR